MLLESGTLLRAPEIAVAASAGMARVRVSSQPAIMVVSTGDELIEPGDPIADFQVRRSNAYAVAATFRRRGFSRVGDDHVLDDENLLRERLSLHLTTHEVVVLSGGVSMGKFDLVPKVLMQLGVQEVFHNVAQRPGKPMWFGIGPQGQSVFGLPGNPVSTLVCLIRYVIPAIAEAMGTKRARPNGWRWQSPVTFKPALAYFLPVIIEHDDWGRPWANPAAAERFGRFFELGGHGWLRGTAARSQHLSQRLRYQRLSLVASFTMTSIIHDIRGAQNPLDRLGRPLHDLRISVMDRCNFRCPYCMPKEQFHENYQFLKSRERLSFDEIVRLSRLFAGLGVRKLRLTGGEPLLRANLADLIGDLTSIPGIEDIALTTNGVLLGKHAVDLRANGLKRITVSLDTLDKDIFARLSGGFGALEQVLERHRGRNRGGTDPGENQRRNRARRQ